MILSILKSYSTLLLSIGLGSLLIFVAGLYWIFRNPPAKSIQPVSAPDITPAKDLTTSDDLRNLSAIAGDDVITTQLDLARAYIETGRKQLATTILTFVLKEGNAQQQQEAQQLMNYRP